MISEKQLAAWEYTLTHLTEGLMILDTKLKMVIEANEKAAELIGISADALKGMPISRFVAHPNVGEEIVDVMLEAVYHKELFSEKVVSSILKNGEQKDIRIRSSLLRNEDENIGIIIFMEDISELTELKKELQTKEKIESLNKQLELRNQYIRKAFGQFMSDRLLAELIDRPGGLEIGGCEANVTVLMSDLRGFTAMCSHTQPQLMFDALNNYLMLMTEAIEKNNGLIIELLGDGILAVFGAPAENQNHAADAVAAAISMQNALEKSNRWNKEHGVSDFAMGIGINTGKMLVGNIGSALRKKYNVFGSNVNLCGRIESYTTDGDILISPATKASIRSALLIDKEFEIMPKGADEPICVSRVRSIGEPYVLTVRLIHQHKFITLDKPVDVVFRCIDGKHIGKEEISGRFTALCEDAGIFESSDALSVFDNIEIDIGGQLFCKVTDEKSGKYFVIFTAKPESFDTWMNTCTAKSAST